jgi:hypothetical protein
MSQLVDFYRGEVTDTQGRWVQDIWGSFERILTFLGLRQEAPYRSGRFLISADTFRYWTEAVKG